MDKTDKKILDSLSENARISTAALARKLSLSRSTIQDRINRLEERGIIDGYTVRLNKDYASRQIKTHVMINVKPNQSATVGRALKSMPLISSLCAISGEYDLIAILTAETTEQIDQTIDAIGQLDGVERTNSSVVLSTKFQR